VDAWYSDEETMKYGELWEDYDEQLLALRCYLKEELLATGLSENKDDIKSMFETEENLAERLSYNQAWNDKNKTIRKFAKNDILSSTRARERAIANEIEHAHQVANRKVFDEVKGYLLSQMTIDQQFGEDFDDKIEKAVENPVVHNFAIDERSNVSRRHLPFNSNRDKAYEEEQRKAIDELVEAEREAQALAESSAEKGSKKEGFGFFGITDDGK